MNQGGKWNLERETPVMWNQIPGCNKWVAKRGAWRVEKKKDTMLKKPSSGV